MTAQLKSLRVIQVWLVFSLFLAALILPVGRAAADDFVFLRNAKNTTAKLSKADARAVFTGKTKNWSNGDVVQVIVTAEGSPEMKWLAEKVVGISEGALRSKMKQEAFKGEMRAVVSVDSVAACIAQLKSVPGGICAADAASAASLPAGIASTAYAE